MNKVAHFRLDYTSDIRELISAWLPLFDEVAKVDTDDSAIAGKVSAMFLASLLGRDWGTDELCPEPLVWATAEAMFDLEVPIFLRVCHGRHTSSYTNKE